MKNMSILCFTIFNLLKIINFFFISFKHRISSILQYESSQRKREEKNRARLKEKEHRFGGPLRRETWIHPESGHRIHRTSPLDPEVGRSGYTSEEEELKQLETSELNKRFILSYLHVLGKLYTRVGWVDIFIGFKYYLSSYLNTFLDKHITFSDTKL